MAVTDGEKVDGEKALKQLEERCKMIKDKAKEEDMSDEDLLQHIRSTIYGFEWKRNKSRKKSGDESLLLTGLLVVGKIILYFMAALIMLYLFVIAVTSVSPRYNRKLTVAMQKYSVIYKYLRIVRLLTLPLHKVIDMGKLSASECLVKNPFYTPEPPSCGSCENITSIETFVFADEELEMALADYEPVVITGEPGYSNVSYDYGHLKTFYEENKVDMEFSFTRSVGETTFKDLEHFFDSPEKDLFDSGVIYGWQVAHLTGTKLMRKLYKRPSFLPIMAEVVIEKTMAVISPTANGTFELPPPGTGQGLLVQSSGESIVTMTPDPYCASNCTVMETNLRQGEIMCYPATPWTVHVKAIGEKLSVFYLASFTST